MDGYAVCTEHQGRHGLVNGGCWLPARERPQPFRWRFSRCEQCGVELDIRTEVRTGQSVTLLAGTDTVHRHEPPITVRLDSDELADAIVRARRAARQERQPQPAQPASQQPQPALPRQANGKPALGGIPEWPE